jgi:hypothetical protein
MNERASDEAGERTPSTHAFVVTLSRVDDDAQPNGRVWRGHITHVASGRRGPITSLGQLDSFVIAYLPDFGARQSLCRRICRWLDRTWQHR